MPTRFGALRNDDVDSGLGLANRVFLGADQRRHGHAAPLAFLDHRGRGDAQRIGDQPDRMAEGDFHQREPVFGRDTHAFAQDRHLRFGGDAIFAQHRIDEALIGRVDHCRPALVVCQFADPRVDDFGDEDVHAVGRAIDMRIDPGEFFLELVGAEPRRTEYAEAPRLADCGNDIAAVTEGE